MPMLTTWRMRLPVCPFHAPLRTRSAKSAMRSSTSCTCGTTSSPSTTIDAPLGARKRHVQHGAILGEVDLVAAEHGVDAVAQSGCFGKLHEQVERLVGDAVFRVVEVEAHGLGRQALAARGVCGKEVAQVQRLDLLVMLLEGRPLRAAGERCQLLCSSWLFLPHGCSAGFLQRLALGGEPAISSFQESTKDLAPSRWRSAASAATSMPARSNLASISSALSSAVSRGPISPWLANASRVRLRHGVDRVRRGERRDVEDVGGLRVLGAGAGPQEPLRPGPGVGQALKAIANRAGRGRRDRCAWPPRCPAGPGAPRGVLPITALSQRLMNTEATERTLGLRPAAMRRSMPRM